MIILLLFLTSLVFLKEGFEIKPGHNNIIALTGTEITAKESLRDLPIHSRNCLFEDENSKMRIHKSYTYSNCIFESALFFAQEMVTQKYNMSIPCMPWFFPSADESITICGPWESKDFQEYMASDIPDEKISHCLPGSVIYRNFLCCHPFGMVLKFILVVYTFQLSM